MRVLVVDDEPEVRTLICDALEAADFACVQARDDGSAYGQLAVNTFALLITDVDLGSGDNGFDVARKARAADPGLPVIYVTATAGPQLESQAVPGAKALLKPFDVDELIELALELRRGEA